MNLVNKMTESLYSSLGKRRDPLNPGAMKIHSKNIAFALNALPVIVDIGRLLIETYKNKTVNKESDTKKISSVNLLKLTAGVFATVAIVSSLVACIKLGIIPPSTLQIFEKIYSAIENPKLVYPGYALMAFIHLYLTKKSCEEKSLVKTVKHIYASTMAITAFIRMLRDPEPPRWHHMSYGLLAMMPNLPALNLFGTCMATDSVLYWLPHSRDDYDYSNIFVENSGLYIVQMVALSSIDIISKLVVK